jgi:gliding motility-associated-like protein
VVVYQVVTPDGDSFNDTWVIDGIDQYPDNSVSIFNRWNSLVYRQSSYSNQQNGWAGEANEGISNGELPDGTYFYTVNLGDGSDILKGFLLLKRK